jgi:DNA polymerase-3 subunit gamma/tau
MGKALYREYRPKKLSEVVGQEHVTTTLANALKQGRISHAYLLTGPRGVGKTSIARILAHEINGLAYDDEAHLDIIEIDAASNRRIDEIRDLRDKVSTAPSAAKYKVYIIDEVHMLTKEAFNALLKTLEEPPAHVVFILATTEAHKLPETIISRTQRYSLRPVPQEQVVALLDSIAQKEKITIDTEALQLIAEHGEGSLRDSTSLLDQASSITNKVTRADVEQILGLAPAEHIASLQTALETGDGASVVTTLAAIYAQGYEPAMVAAQLGERLRSAVLAGTLTGSLDTHATLQLLQKLLDVPAARSPKQLLELTLLQAALGTGASSASAPPQATHTETARPAPKPVVAQPAPEVEKPAVPAAPPAPTPKSKVTDASPEPEPELEPEPTEPVQKPAAATATNLSDVDVKDLWQQTLDDIKKQYNTLYGIARMATPELEGNRLTLHMKFAFHQKRLGEAKNRKLLSDVVERLSGQPIEIVCVVSEAPAATAKPEKKPDIATVSNIFGGAELLES